MKPALLISLLLFLSGPSDLLADRSHYGNHHRIGVPSHANPYAKNMHSRVKLPSRHPSRDIRGQRKYPARHASRNLGSRRKRPSRLPVSPGYPGKPVHPIYPGGKPGHGRPGYWWPASTTIVREHQPIIIVNNPPPEAPPPPPEPEKVWVPPVMDTRTEPGYWDYGIKKLWMGDHWRYEQDHTEKTWVPEYQVEVVKQEGYWQPVE